MKNAGEVSVKCEWQISEHTNSLQELRMMKGKISLFISLWVIVAMILDSGAYGAVSDHVLRIEMSTSYNYDFPDVPLHYEFKAEIQVDATVVSGSLQVPSGNVYAMVYVDKGDEILLGLYINDSDQTVLDDFGSGTYTFTVNYTEGSPDSTSVDYELPNGDPIPQVTEEPQFVYPQHNAVDVPLHCTFQFVPASNPDHTIDIWIEPEDGTLGALSHDIMGLSHDTSSYGPVTLSPETLYEGGYSINYYVNMINADGIPAEMDTDAETQILFTTAESRLDIDRLGISACKQFRDGVAQGPYPWSLDIGVSVADPGALHHVEITKPADSDPFVTLYEEAAPPGWWSCSLDDDYASLSALRVVYPEGTYTFDFLDSGGVLIKSLSINYTDLPGEPTEPVEFTYPSTNGQSGISVNPTFTWSVSPDAGDALMMCVDNDEVVYFVAPVSIASTSWTPGHLLAHHNYELDVFVVNIKDWAGGPAFPTMTDGTGDTFCYSHTIEYLNEIVFTTNISCDFCGPSFAAADGYVDVWDLMQFADHWHIQTGEVNWDAKFDLSGSSFSDPDGYIDVWDLMTFADHWHEGEPP